MEKVVLKAEKRTEKPNAARAKNLLPAVIYGKGKEALPLSVEQSEFKKAYKEAGSSAIITLKVDGEDKNVLVQDVQRHPVTDEFIHADFYEVSLTEKITTTVPLKFVGDAPAVLDQNGTLMTNKNELEVECLPLDLPHEIEVDISSLDDFEKAIHVTDVVVSDKVEIKDDLEAMVVTVEPPRSEEEIAELEEPVAEGEMPESEHGEDDQPGSEDVEDKEQQTE
ncbi:MAG: 50S ribosomal protein L25 [Patescibacteria group bacterium]|nr:50S ribosomal protein L25 [Patescibacteria group bacterium]